MDDQNLYSMDDKNKSKYINGFFGTDIKLQGKRLKMHEGLDALKSQYSRF